MFRWRRWKHCAPEYSNNAYLIMVQGATPIPYKLVTIASGLAGVHFPLFMLYSAITRSVRYIVIEAMLVYFFGDRPRRCSRNISKLALIAVPGRRWCWALSRVYAYLLAPDSVLLQFARQLR